MDICFECDEPATHQHHVVPHSRGGRRTIPLCVKCHSLAHDVKLGSLSGKRYTAEDRIQMIQLYRAGLSIAKIAKRMNCGHQVVSKAVRGAGLTPKRGPQFENGEHRKMRPGGPKEYTISF